MPGESTLDPSAYRKALERLSAMEASVHALEERRQRARERLLRADGKQWHFALLGLEMDVDDYDIESTISLRPVIEPPHELDLAGAIGDKSIWSAVGRYSRGIRHELTIDRRFGSTEQGPFTLAWWFISALRTRTLSDFLVPAVADYSWSTIAGVKDGVCNIQLLEDVPRARRFATAARVSQADLDWTMENLPVFVTLLEDPRFRLAVDCLTTHQHEASLRMTTASLWAGIEALIGVNAELRFRLSALISSLLEPRGSGRTARYRALKTLYDFRSRAVHGAALDDNLIVQHILDVRHLLSSLICEMVDSKRIPSAGDWEKVLFE